MDCTTSIIQRYDFDFFVHFNDISCNSQIVTLNMVLDLQWHRHQHRHRRRHRHHQHDLSSSRCVFVVKTCIFPTHVGSSGLTGVCWTLFSPPCFPCQRQCSFPTGFAAKWLNDWVRDSRTDWPTDSPSGRLAHWLIENEHRIRPARKHPAGPRGKEKKLLRFS